ncbi:hypothetical protein [Commensalibacter communis]|uniref:hypothetical protein n=1 Tax=Commensalibacter communis TaxID=2972786 RepID=UPI00232E488C|nr:hypothetical protein [Commensalibacter communis]
MIVLAYKFIRSKGSVITSTLCILFGSIFIYVTYLAADLLWTLGCSLGRLKPCKSTWEKLNATSDIRVFYFIASLGAIYILLGFCGILHKLYQQYLLKKQLNKNHHD